MTDTKWRSHTGHSISSDVTDKLPPETGDFLTRGQDDVSEDLLYRIDKMLSVQPDKEGWFNSIHDIEIRISRDEAAEIKRALAQQQSDAELANVMAKIYEEERAKYIGGVVYYPNNQEAFKGAMLKAIARAEQKGGV